MHDLVVCFLEELEVGTKVTGLAANNGPAVANFVDSVGLLIKDSSCRGASLGQTVVGDQTRTVPLGLLGVVGYILFECGADVVKQVDEMLSQL